jgi:hypothetical protein
MDQSVQPCVPNAGDLIGCATATLLLSISMVCEGLREHWTSDFSSGRARWGVRAVLAGGIGLTVLSWLALTLAYSTMVTVGVSDGFNLSFKTACLFLQAGPVLLFLLTSSAKGVLVVWLGWAGLGRAGLGWVGQGWVGLGGGLNFRMERALCTCTAPPPPHDFPLVPTFVCGQR